MSCNVIYTFANAGAFSEKVLKALDDVMMQTFGLAVPALYPCINRLIAALLRRYMERKIDKMFLDTFFCVDLLREQKK